MIGAESAHLGDAMTNEELVRGLNWYAIEWSRQYDTLRCVVCDKILDDTNGMYSWPITHGHPTAAVTVVFGCGDASHSKDDYDRAATREFGWKLIVGGSLVGQEEGTR